MAEADDRLNTVYHYHDATKHHPGRYARSRGYLDWATQPDPFLRLAGADLVELPAPAPGPDPAWDQVPGGGLPAAPLNAATVSRLLWTSLALSAWKQVDGPDGRVVSRWSLRVNPSSGNLHPTEGWLACGPVPGLADSPSLHHYRADLHALERCRTLADDAWAALGPGRLLVGLSSVVWREAWKYGERAYRYCSHDAGHALAAVDLAAAALGWRTRLLDEVADADLARLLGCDRRPGPERDDPEALVLVDTGGTDHDVIIPSLGDLCDAAPWAGSPEPLSPSHHHWPRVDGIRAAAAWPGLAWPPRAPGRPEAPRPPRAAGFTDLVRGRRSAVAMDGRTSLPAPEFFALLGRLMPDRTPRPFGLLPWTPTVSLALMVHRVDGLAPGLFVLVRDPSHEPPLRAGLRPEVAWEPVAAAPADLPLFRLGGGDLRAHAAGLSCGQAIAGDGAFAVAMLARFAETLDARGPGMYPRLFRETGVVGQMLYLEAEAAGLQGTGIGCFFDDEVHRLLGITDHAWQSLYHFTVGGAVDDPRIRTAPAYARLHPEPERESGPS